MKKEAILITLLLCITFSSAFNFETGGVKIIDPIDSVNGGVSVSIIDGDSRPFDIRAFQITNLSITLASDTIIGSYDINLTMGHGVIVGDQLSMFVEFNTEPQIYFGNVLNVVGDIITLDTQAPFNFSAGTLVAKSIEQMNVDGSVNEQAFGITNPFSRTASFTRFIFHITDNTVMDDDKFGGGNSLTRGVVMRKRLTDGTYINYYNIKTNGEFGELAYDKTYDDKAPAGVYGLTVRLTYAGQSKHGVVINIETGETLEFLVQDDLTDLSGFTVMLEGHQI